MNEQELSLIRMWAGRILRRHVKHRLHGKGYRGGSLAYWEAVGRAVVMLADGKPDPLASGHGPGRWEAYRRESRYALDSVDCWVCYLPGDKRRVWSEDEEQAYRDGRYVRI